MRILVCAMSCVFCFVVSARSEELEDCICLVDDGTYSCNTYGGWSQSPDPYPCTTVLCVSGSCPLSEAATESRVNTSQEEWDALRAKFRPPIAPQKGNSMKNLTGYTCYTEFVCRGCEFQAPRLGLPAGQYCVQVEKEVVKLAKMALCKDANGVVLPPCDGPAE